MASRSGQDLVTRALRTCRIWAILAAAVEGSQVDIDNASLIESRYFVSLLTGPGEACNK